MSPFSCVSQRPWRLRLAAIGTLLLAATNGMGQDAHAVRTWTDDRGRQVEAVMWKLEGTVVHLRRASDGKAFALPAERLSAADRQYLQTLRPSGPTTGSPPSVTVTDPARSLVLVVARAGDIRFPMPGIVYRRDSKRAYIVVAGSRVEDALFDRQSQPGAEPMTYVVLCDGEEGEPTPAQRLGSDPRSSFRLFAAPAGQMPPAIVVEPPPPLGEPERVTVIGYEVDETIFPPALARIVEPGTLKEVSRNERGDLTGMKIDCPGVVNLALGMVADASGKVLGFIVDSASRGPDPYISAVPLARIEKAEQPVVLMQQFGFHSGNEQEINYEFVMRAADPVNRMQQPRLFVLWWPHRSGRLPYQNPADGIWTEPFAESVEIPLQAREPADMVRRQISQSDSYPGTKCWAAIHRTKHPGPRHEHTFLMQLSYSDGNGQATFTSPKFVTVSSARRMEQEPRYRRALPDIPGLDGYPFDFPRPVRMEDGSYRMTSGSTRVKDAAPAATGVLPRPKPSGQSRAGRLSRTGTAAVVDLNLPGHTEYGGHHFSQRPAVFSPDGKWLYLLDAKHVLRKIDAASLKEESYLAVGATCGSVSYSREGLLVAVADQNAVWVVDAQSLAVLRTIPVPGVRFAVGSPGTPYGFAFANSVGRVRHHELVMLDLAEGRPRHRWKNSYGSATGSGTYSLRIEDIPILQQPLHEIYVSPDGRYVLTGGQWVTRYHLEGEDLYFEQVGPDPRDRASMPRVQAIDRRWAFVRMSDGRGLLGFEHDNLATPRLEISQDRAPESLSSDPVSGNFYLADSSLCTVLGPRGGRVNAFEEDNVSLYRLVVHPGGGRFVSCGIEKLRLFDLEPERLAKAIGKTLPRPVSPDADPFEEMQRHMDEFESGLLDEPSFPPELKKQIRDGMQNRPRN